LLICGGIDLSRIHIGPIPYFDAWTELVRILDFQPTAKQSVASSTGKDASRPQPRKISSNQIFMGISGCPRAFHLIFYRTTRYDSVTIFFPNIERISNQYVCFFLFSGYLERCSR
jgi:hypothetical protein